MAASINLPKRIVLVDIDALRHDTLQAALADGAVPNLARMLGGADLAKGIQYDAISTAPSLTYCCQASSFTGAHPRQHWILGNQFFDRFGRLNGGRPRKYEFDFTDFPAVFMKGLAGDVINPDVPTIYEIAAEHNLTSTVAFNMYAHGAQHWLRPGLDDWRDFVSTSKRGLGEKYDDAMLHDVVEHLQTGARPDLLTLYFFGLDHESHLYGPGVQYEYLKNALDRQIGEFLHTYEALGLMPGTLFVIFSDHGQIEVSTDDLHGLKVGFLMDREMGYVFEALDLDVQDHPLEGPNCDAMLTPQGGLALVYLRRRQGAWKDAPHFADVLRLAQAFWEANQDGSHSAELRGALDLIAVRDVEHEGWYAEYRAYTPQGLLPLADYLAAHPEIEALDAVNRLHYMTCPVTGDVLLASNYRDGYSFVVLPYRGTHGGLHPQDSRCVLAYGWPDGSPEQVEYLRQVVSQSILARCREEGNRHIGNVDMIYGLRALMGWL